MHLLWAISWYTNIIIKTLKSLIPVPVFILSLFFQNISLFNFCRHLFDVDLALQESLADAKVSARQHACMKAPSKEIYSKFPIDG